ncbi:MAG: minichromosome maintenance protein MCM [Methanomassiliicoccaceae archaeon]|jgi:replicative DNA helicase Mcm|nr:minichromosome maintenance protein MCM [Methanomassiliicoccaceae archaeon]
MNFKEEEVLAGWEDILSKKYQLEMTKIADSFPEERSVFVSYKDIDEYNPDLAMFITDRPDRCLALGRKAIRNLMPPSWDNKGTINLRIIKLPRDNRVEIRALRSEHLRKLVAIEGLVKKTTPVKPRMTRALFVCTKCGAEQWIEQTGMRIRKPTMCTSSDGSCNRSLAKFDLSEERCVYLDTQKIEIQEFPEALKGGAQPERIMGYLEDDITGSVFPGNRVILNGVIKQVQKSERDESAVFETYMDIHSVDFEEQEYDEILITEDDEAEIQRMSKDAELFEKMIRSISPTIYGLETEKEAIALQLFGGTPKKMEDGTVIRGDIHILLVGDPGVAKSQLLRYMTTLAPRGIYASGKSASAAGLTAAAVKDDFSGEGGRWMLEAGALVLADKGLACIDELDKMSEHDTSALHEAMESQKISVAKAGITATLPCRCSLLAAANPKRGRFGDGDIGEQINLPPTLMSRFDMIFTLKDKPDPKADTRLTEHILNAHRRGQVRKSGTTEGMEDLAGKIMAETGSITPSYARDIMRKYVAYSKRITPVMSDDAYSRIRENYLKIRATGGGNLKSVPITARQLEAYIRLSEASARARLSRIVTKEDAERSIRIIHYYLDKVFGNEGTTVWDSDRVSTGMPAAVRNVMQLVKDTIREYVAEKGVGISKGELLGALAGQIQEKEILLALKKMDAEGEIYAPAFDVYKLLE